MDKFGHTYGLINNYNVDQRHVVRIRTALAANGCPKVGRRMRITL